MRVARPYLKTQQAWCLQEPDSASADAGIDGGIELGAGRYGLIGLSAHVKAPSE